MSTKGNNANGHGNGNNGNHGNGNNGNNGNHGNGNNGNHGNPPPRPVKPTAPFAIPGEPRLPRCLASPWWLGNPVKWDFEKAEMQSKYPGWTAGLLSGPGGQMMAWKGKLSPIVNDPCQLSSVIHALKKNRLVDIRAGLVLPSAEYGEFQPDVPEHVYAILQKEWSFTVRAIHLAPPGHPIIQVISPKLERFRHVNSDGSICVLKPSSGIWSWETNSIADYVDHTAIWLVKYIVYLFTGEWIGLEASHDPSILRRTPKNAQCYCGSGLPYRLCHYTIDN